MAFKYGVEARQIISKKIQKAKLFNALEVIRITEASLDSELRQLGLTGKLHIVDAIKRQLEMAREAVWAVLADTLRTQAKVCFDSEFTANLVQSYVKYKYVADLRSLVEQSFKESVVQVAFVHLSQYDTYHMPAWKVVEQVQQFSVMNDPKLELFSFHVKSVSMTSLVKDICSSFAAMLYNQHMFIRYISNANDHLPASSATHKDMLRELQIQMIKSQRPRLIRHVDRVLAQILKHFSKQILDDFNARQMFDLLNSVGFFVKIMY